MKAEPQIDYRDLLRKYMLLIMSEEGISYLEHVGCGWVAPGVKLSKREIAVLQDIATKAWYELVEDER